MIVIRRSVPMTDGLQGTRPRHPRYIGAEEPELTMQRTVSGQMIRFKMLVMACAWITILSGCSDSRPISEGDLVPSGATAGFVSDAAMDAHISRLKKRLARQHEPVVNLARLARDVQHRNLRYLVELMEAMHDDGLHSDEMLRVFDVVQSRIVEGPETSEHERGLLLRRVMGVVSTYPADEVAIRFLSGIENPLIPVRVRALYLMQLVRLRDELDGQGKADLIAVVSDFLDRHQVESDSAAERWYFSAHVWPAALRLGLIESQECCDRIRSMQMTEQDWDRLDEMRVSLLLDWLYEECCGGSD